MSWWGKGIGASVGFALGGPLGALLGGVIGHQVDRQQDRRELLEAHTHDQQATTQAAFFTATFAVMGRLAKIDGRVSQSEIEMARHIMGRMQLNQSQRRAAIDLFNQGKSDDFDLEAVLDQFKSVVHRRSALIQMFLEIQISAALADGVIDTRESNLLLHICQRLGYSQIQFQLLFSRVAASMGLWGSSGPGGASGGSTRDSKATSRKRLEQSYAILGIEPAATNDELKRAYRRLMSQNHPDKLVSKGLPEEMMQLANEKTQQIKNAYETIKEARSMK
ncbi:co-chaperone DjlA [Acidihalobacter prosperus]